VRLLRVKRKKWRTVSYFPLYTPEELKEVGEEVKRWPNVQPGDYVMLKEGYATPVRRWHGKTTVILGKEWKGPEEPSIAALGADKATILPGVYDTDERYSIMLTYRRRAFARLTATFFDPVEAARLVSPQSKNPTRVALKYMRDPVTQRLIMDEVEDFLAKHGLTREWVVAELKKFVTNQRISGSARKDVLLFLAQITGIGPAKQATRRLTSSERVFLSRGDIRRLERVRTAEIPAAAPGDDGADEF